MVVWAEAQVVIVQDWYVTVALPGDEATAAFNAPVKWFVLRIVLNRSVGVVPIDVGQVLDIGVCDHVVRVGAA